MLAFGGFLFGVEVGGFGWFWAWVLAVWVTLLLVLGSTKQHTISAAKTAPFPPPKKTHQNKAQVDRAPAAGINGVEWDAVELPSQFMENWCYDEKTVYDSGLARHYQVRCCVFPPSTTSHANLPHAHGPAHSSPAAHG